MLTTIIAGGTGMLCSEIFQPGTRITMPSAARGYDINPKPIRDILLKIFSVNPLASILHNDVLYLIVFAVITGIVCIFLGEKGKKISGFFGKIAGIMQNLTYMVMFFAPLGVFALSSTAAAECRRSPVWFFRGIYEPAMTAFITRSSSVTIPITLENVQKNFGVSEGISSFVIPLGATLNMDGTAIYQIIASLFIARAYDVPITFALQTGRGCLRE